MIFQFDTDLEDVKPLYIPFNTTFILYESKGLLVDDAIVCQLTLFH